MPEYRVLATLMAVYDCPSLPAHAMRSVCIFFVQISPVTNAHSKVPMATTMAIPFWIISWSLTETVFSGKIISRSAIGMSTYDLMMSGPHPEGPAASSSSGLAMR